MEGTEGPRAQPPGSTHTWVICLGNPRLGPDASELPKDSPAPQDTHGLWTLAAWELPSQTPPPLPSQAALSPYPGHPWGSSQEWGAGGGAPWPGRRAVIYCSPTRAPWMGEEAIADLSQ